MNPRRTVYALLFLLPAVLSIPSAGRLLGQAGGPDDTEAPELAGAGERSPLAEAIRNRVEAAAGLPDRLVVGGERVQTVTSLSVFYEQRLYEPAWVRPEGLGIVGRRLLETLAGSDRDALLPGDYHVARIREDTEALGADEGEVDMGRLVDIELLLTDGFLLYGTHLLAGRIDAASLDPKWRAERREVDLVALLERAVREETPRRSLHSLRPPQPEYARLMEALAAYRDAAAEAWPRVPEGERLSPGDVSDRVVALRRRLAAVPVTLRPATEAPPAPAGVDSARYDDALGDAVRAFQRRHGLESDGVIGQATLAALNASPADRIRQLEVNLERWRWLPQSLGERHVLVNAADYSLVAVRADEVEISMRAIVGRPYRRTPVFSDRMTYIVFRPYWHVPHELAVEDQLPLQQKDPGYFRRMGFRLFEGWGADAAEVDPASIDWSQVTARTFVWRLRQDPGPENFLGAAKFMFPNPFNVYLHDTPNRDLFREQRRNFSSGCIRIEDPRALALWLLGGTPGWSVDRVDGAMRSDREETVYLVRPVPVHLLYWTAFVDDGVVQFRTDIYDRDAPLAEALRTPPTREAPADPSTVSS